MLYVMDESGTYLPASQKRYSPLPTEVDQTISYHDKHFSTKQIFSIFVRWLNDETQLQIDW